VAFCFIYFFSTFCDKIVVTFKKGGGWMLNNLELNSQDKDVIIDSLKYFIKNGRNRTNNRRQESINKAHSISVMNKIRRHDNKYNANEVRVISAALAILYNDLVDLLDEEHDLQKQKELEEHLEVIDKLHNRFEPIIDYLFEKLEHE